MFTSNGIQQSYHDFLLAYFSAFKSYYFISIHLWQELASRSEYSITKDVHHLKRIILKELFHLRPSASNLPLILFFIENDSLGIHLHIIHEAPPDMTSPDTLQSHYQQVIRPKVKCMSRQTDILVKSVYDVNSLLKYLLKQCSTKHVSIDFVNSIL